MGELLQADIVLSQQRCAKILVGDPHQQIYSFMGAVNAMNTAREKAAAPAGDADMAGAPLPAVLSRVLTRSFRFGPSIADVANAVLRIKGERRSVLGGRGEGSMDPVGPGGVQLLQGLLHALNHGNRAAAGGCLPLTVLCRYNSSVIQVAAELASNDVPLAFVGGAEGMGLDDLVAMYRLAIGDTAAIRSHPFLRY